MATYEYAFGPVPSRRLGKSLGINNIPAKTCSYACVYCQVGGTTRMQADPLHCYPPEEICAEVERRVAKVQAAEEKIDYLAFVPDGEPTLDLNLGEAIHRLRALEIPIGVITNSSLLWREDVRETLAGADWVSVKIDAVDEKIWRKVNRPHKALQLEAILEGVTAFAERFAGKLVTETMLVGGVNDREESLRGIADFLGRLHPRTAYLSIPTRPPAVGWVKCPDETSLNRAFQIVSERVEWVECLIGYEGNAFAYSGDIEKDLLSVTAVHPMREEAVEKLLAQAAASGEVVEKLLACGDLLKTIYNGHAFYVRRFRKHINASD